MNESIYVYKLWRASKNIGGEISTPVIKVFSTNLMTTLKTGLLDIYNSD